MSKLKPKWVKTDIPREIKIKLWRIMKDNPTFVTWQEYIADNSQLFTESESKYVPYSRDTYKRLQQEITEIPLDEIRLLPDDLQVWIKEIKGLRPDVGLVDRSKVTVYKETPHKRKMRNSAKYSIKEIASLSVRESLILELAPGQLSQGKQKFPVSITEEGEIRVALSIEGEGGIGLPYKSLRAHLETGGFTKVLTDISSWSRGTADNLKKCHKLFTTVRKKLEHTYDTSIAISIPLDCQGQPIFTQSGFTMYFPVLICADALEQARGSIHYRDCTYSRDGLNLNFDVYTIYIGTSDEHMQLFEDAHREWRARCAMWEQTKATAKQRQDLDNTATAINQQLQKFIDMERLPGYCELCS